MKCDGSLDIQEAGNTKVICVYLIGAFCPHLVNFSNTEVNVLCYIQAVVTNLKTS